VLLAGLNAPANCRDRVPSHRDHTERMLAGFGAEIQSTDEPDEGRVITLTGSARTCKPSMSMSPRDPSSAAFSCRAAVDVPGSECAGASIGSEPRRGQGLDFTTLRRNGADLTYET